MGRFDGKVAFITGAGQGIGLGIALALATEGADIAIADVEADRAQRAADQVRRRGATVCVAVCDIRDRAQVDAMLEAGRQRFGPVDIVAHVAGTAWHVSLSEMGDDDYDRLMDVHVRATFHLLRATVEEFKERGSGKFIAVTSPAAVRGQVNGTIYSAAKSAVLGIVRSAALELAPFGAQVNAVLPMAATPMTELVVSDPSVNERYLANVPLHRWGSPVEIARGFLYLASADSDYVTGTVLTIDGGRTI
jgi:3-oxoacyl-[acyl-carrier protein] reductase